MGWGLWVELLGVPRDERRRILPMHVHVHLSSITGPRVPIRTAGFLVGSEVSYQSYRLGAVIHSAVVVGLGFR